MAGAGRAAPIIETVVTTINPDGSVNCGAMGVEWGDERIVIKPYGRTRTLRNLRATGAAVVMDLAEAPVHDRGRVADDTAGDVGECLMAEADPEHRHIGALKRVQRDADVALAVGAARTR